METAVSERERWYNPGICGAVKESESAPSWPVGFEDSGQRTGVWRRRGYSSFVYFFISQAPSASLVHAVWLEAGVWAKIFMYIYIFNHKAIHCNRKGEKRSIRNLLKIRVVISERAKPADKEREDGAQGYGLHAWLFNRRCFREPDGKVFYAAN